MSFKSSMGPTKDAQKALLWCPVPYASSGCRGCIACSDLRQGLGYPSHLPTGLQRFARLISFDQWWFDFGDDRCDNVASELRVFGESYGGCRGGSFASRSFWYVRVSGLHCPFRTLAEFRSDYPPATLAILIQGGCSGFFESIYSPLLLKVYRCFVWSRRLCCSQDLLLLLRSLSGVADEIFHKQTRISCSPEYRWGNSVVSGEHQFRAGRTRWSFFSRWYICNQQVPRINQWYWVPFLYIFFSS